MLGPETEAVPEEEEEEGEQGEGEEEECAAAPQIDCVEGWDREDPVEDAGAHACWQGGRNWCCRRTR